MAEEKYNCKYNFNCEHGSNPTFIQDSNFYISGDFITTPVKRKNNHETENEQQENSARIKKFSDLFDPSMKTKAEAEYKQSVQPLLVKCMPDSAFMRVVSFQPREKDNDGNKISKDQVYKAFGKMKIYLSKDLSEEDYAKWLSSHVGGMTSISSWQRYL